MSYPSEDPYAGLRNGQCLVIGAGGFLGTHLCQALLAKGARVHGFGRRLAYPEDVVGIRWTAGEFSDRAALARAVEGAEIVFHLLASSTPESSNKDPLADLEANVVASINLLEICRAAGTRRIVFASSGGTVYGIPEKTPITESASTNPISAYGVTKLTVEKYLGLYHHLHRLDYAVLRLANPFGPYQDPFRRQGVVPALARAVLDGRPAEIWGDGLVVRDYLYAADAADALLRAASYPGRARVFNVGSGVGRSVLDVLAAICDILGVDQPERHHKPGRPADVPVSILDNALIRREMGWSPATPWPGSLRPTIEWLRRSTR